eukprot:superscaffoldBa00002483_g14429
MAASFGSSKGPELSKAEYLKRYLSTDEDAKKSKGKLKKKRRKVPEKGLKIVDDDIDWKQMVREEKEVEEEEDEAPVIHLLPGENPAHRYQVRNVHLIPVGHRWLRGLRTDMIQTLTSHLHEKSHKREELRTLTNLHQEDVQKQDGALILTSLHPGGGHRVGRSQMKICHHLVGLASHRMLSGGKAGLVSVDVLRKEQEENRRRERHNQPLEDESRNAQTVFRDKSGKRRDLDSEREEQKKKAGEKAAKDEKYAQWGKGSNGFEKKRYMRMADKKAMQEAAYKWSVEDM